MGGGPVDPRWSEATRLIRTAGGPETAATPMPVAVNPPIQRGSTVLIPSAEQLHSPDICTYGLGRGLATHEALAAALAELEHAPDVSLYPSGLASVTGPLLALLKAGDEVLMADAVYGPTRRFANGVLKRFGVATRYFPPRAGPDEILALAGPATRLVFLESPGSLTFEIADTAAIAAACRARGVLTMMDNTWAAGVLFKPLDHGVDISIQALTKYVGGHADVFMGSAAARDPKILRALCDGVTDLGWGVSADDAYAMLRGLRTLPTRLHAHAAGALEVARWLGGRPEVAQVLHPALETSPDHALWKRDFTGANGLFGVVLKPVAVARARAMLDALRLFGLGFSWGGYESLAVLYDARLPRTAQPLTFEGPLLRLHVGLEDPADLIADLERGFAALAGGAG